MDEAERTRLGLDRPIARRDVLHGIGLAGLGAGVGGGASASPAAPEPEPANYPPLRTGMRGSHPGSFEIAHALRDGALDVAIASPPIEQYDLVVVGGGISGLSAALFWQEARPQARILILENHDDFGGHAKRNEFRRGGRTQLLNGGTLAIESPTPYSPVANGVLKRIGIDAAALSDKAEAWGRANPARHATFFDRETFGTDRLVHELGSRPEAWGEMPVSAAVRRDVRRIEAGTEDWLPGLSSDEKKDRLSRISYAAFLTDIVKADPGVLPFYQQRPLGWWGVGSDAVTALDVWAMGYPGFGGMKLAPGAIARMGYTPLGYARTGGSPDFHFPDGNATIARGLVRALIPDALPGAGVEDLVAATADYAALDRPGAPVRLRLSATAVRVANVGGQVEIVYANAGKLTKVAAGQAVLACWNMIIPYLAPELPARQKAALHDLVKVPLVYVSAALTSRRAWEKAGVDTISYPGGWYENIALNRHMPIGGIVCGRGVDDPVLVHAQHVPCAPGLPEHDQNRAGRAALLATPLSTYEMHLRDQLDRALGAYGFDAARDIEAITVNRWPHGYAPEFNPLWEPVSAPGEAPNEIARQRFGRVAIANADSGRAAYTDVAIDQAHRAVSELLA